MERKRRGHSACWIGTGGRWCVQFMCRKHPDPGHYFKSDRCYDQ